MRKRGRQGKRLPFDGLCACAEPVHGVRQLQSRFNGRKYPSIVENISVDKKCQRWHIYSVSEVGKRLKNARIAKGLSLRKFAERFREDFAVLAHIEAGTHLKQIGSPLCEFQRYVPLPEAVLRDTVEKIIKSGVIARYSELSGAKFPLNFSTSLVNKGSRQVFWDIVSPALKFEGLNSLRQSDSATPW